MKLLLKGGRIVDPISKTDGTLDLLVDEGLIVRIGEGIPADGARVLDLHGLVVAPGFVDMHVHGGGPPKNSEAEYPYKLWLAHGVTAVRGVPLESVARVCHS